MIYVWFGLMLGYAVVQMRLACRLSGGWRLAAVGPLLITVPALVLSILALLDQNDFWPLPLLCGMPLALLVLVSVRGIHWAYADPTRRAS